MYQFLMLLIILSVVVICRSFSLLNCLSFKVLTIMYKFLFISTKSHCLLKHLFTTIALHKRRFNKYLIIIFIKNLYFRVVYKYNFDYVLSTK